MMSENPMLDFMKAFKESGRTDFPHFVDLFIEHLETGDMPEVLKKSESESEPE